LMKIIWLINFTSKQASKIKEIDKYEAVDQFAK
jgi:hypothetical protein